MQTFTRQVLTALPLIGLLAIGCSQAPEPETVSSVLATVQGQEITEAAFQLAWGSHPPDADTPGTREALLNELVQRQILVQRARTAGLDQDPVVIEAIESLLIARLKEKELHPRIDAISVTEEDIRAFYEQNKEERYRFPERVRLAALWFDTRGQDLLVQRYRPRLDQAREGLMADPASIPIEAGFGALSVRNTEHRGSRYRGGDVGWVEVTPGLDAWRNALLELAAPLSDPGQLSPVTVRPEGIFLVRLVDRQPARIQTFAEVRSDIVRRLESERRVDAEDQFRRLAGRDFLVETFPERLAALEGLPAPVLARTATSSPNPVLVPPEP